MIESGFESGFVMVYVLYVIGFMVISYSSIA